MEDQLAEVLALWQQHRRALWKREENSPTNTRWLHLINRRIALMALGCILLAVQTPCVRACRQFIATEPGLKAHGVFAILIVWNWVCLALLILPNCQDVRRFFSRWDRDLFESTAAAYDRDRCFVQALAKHRGLELGRIGRRLKEAVESREKFSGALALFAGGASFWSLASICNNIVKGDLTPWCSLPTAGLLVAAIALRTLLISVRIRELLVCLEEAEELRQKLHSNRCLDQSFIGAE
jgi:hypothetical protein